MEAVGVREWARGGKIDTRREEETQCQLIAAEMYLREKKKSHP